MAIESGGAAAFWDSEVVEHRHFNWMAIPEVRRYLNTRIGGSEHDWPMNWFVRFLNGRRFPRALSIGCGTGAMERDLVLRNLADTVDAFDASLGSLEIARAEASRAGMADRIRYFAADFNEPVLPGARNGKPSRDHYDAVFFHHSLHHVAKLEKLMRAVMLALKDDGLLYLDEYVGPSRLWWTDEHFARERELYAALVPPSLRKFEILPLPVVPGDPSEAIRSGEILEQLRVGFEVVEHRGYGGNLLSVLCPGVDFDGAPPSLIEELIEAEKAHLAEGHSDWLAVIVARRRRGVGRAVASARYFTEPKLRRVGRELRHLARLGRAR